MRPTDNGHLFLSRVSEYLLSLPFDLKILQEALTNDELPRALREQATGVLIQAFSHQEGSGPERFFDDVLLLRIMLGQIAAVDSDEAQSFCDRFDEIFSTLDHDLPLLESVLGPELWSSLTSRLGSLGKLLHRGKRPAQYVSDDASWDLLYDDGIDFQTAYNVTEEQVRNRLRKAETILDTLHKRGARLKPL
ncbi:MAG: hypothetical protein U0745_01125 [Polyangia bacterium]|jgi:hypothetical protein